MFWVHVKKESYERVAMFHSSSPLPVVPASRWILKWDDHGQGLGRGAKPMRAILFYQLSLDVNCNTWLSLQAKNLHFGEVGPELISWLGRRIREPRPAFAS